MRNLLLAVVLMSLAVSPALAGDEHAMDEWAKCHVCKVMMPKMAELMPVMKMEIVTMDNGMAMLSTVTDPEKVGMYHETCDAMHVAGAETMSFTAEQAKENLCPMCFELWSIMSAGGSLSAGKTANGHLMVLTSEDEQVQQKIAALQKQYETSMMGG